MEKRVLNLIKKNYSGFTESQKKIGNYISENYNKVIYMSAQSLATELGISDATIIRFSKCIGFSGFSEMRDAIRNEINIYDSPHERLLRNYEFDNNIDSLFHQVAKNDFLAHEHFFNNINYTLIDQVAEEIHKAETIHLIGFGTDQIVAVFLDWYLRIMGFKTVCYTENGFEFSNRFSVLKSNDLVIIGVSPRHLKDEKIVIDIVKQKGAKIVSLTTQRMSDVIMTSDISLTVETKGTEFLNSYVAFMSLCNLILVRVYEKDSNKIYSKLKNTSSFIDHFKPYL